MKNNLLIFGIGETAQTVFNYIIESKIFNLMGFVANTKYITDKEINSYPVLPFESIEKYINPIDCSIIIAISYTGLNSVREKIYNETKTKGFNIATFISDKSYVSKTALIKEGVFIYDNVSINHNCIINENTVICSGTVISHSCIIGKNVYISAKCGIGGFTQIGNNNFIGIGGTIIDKIKTTDNVILSAGSVLSTHANNPNIYKGFPAKDSGVNSKIFLELNGEIS
jgi:sugar O-acyltransferase (sialic acid O-acetyltransferase NeuD family)